MFNEFNKGITSKSSIDNFVTENCAYQSIIKVTPFAGLTKHLYLLLNSRF